MTENAHSLFTEEDEKTLEYTKDIRTRIVKELVKDNKVPEDSDDRKFLMSALDGLDRAVISKAKIRVDSKSANTAAESRALVANALLEIAANRQRERNSIQVPKELDKSFETGALVPGQLDLTNVVDLGIDNIIPE